MEFYSIKDVAELSGKSQKTVRRHIAAGLLKHRKISNKYRIYINDYTEWINQNPVLNANTIIQNDTENELAITLTPQEQEPVATTREDIVNYVDVEDRWERDFWNNQEDSNELTFIDLFSGAGGLSLGFVQAGYTPLASVEINEFAVRTYEHNFINTRGFNEFVESRDITRKEVKEDLYNAVGNRNVDVIVGGFPCQGFSPSGNRIIADPRNSLYLHMLEIVRHIQPRVVVMENVVGLRTMMDGQIEAKIISDYTDAGYNVNVTVLNSANYGVPQTRQRVIFICNRIGVENLHPRPFVTPENYVTIQQAIEDLMDLPDDRSINHVRTKHSTEMIERLQAVPEGKSLYDNYSDAWKKSPWNKPSCTIKENHGAVNIHPRRPRVITAREMARLQSFPDNFIFQGAKKWQLVQLGNAVPPGLGKAIGLAVESMLLR